MSYILILETSTEVCSVCVIDKEQIISTVESLESFQHTAKLTIQIEQALSEAQIAISDLSAVAISSGPGSYTGLRVGSSTAKGICFAQDIPLISLNSLKGLSYVKHDLVPNANNYIISMIDARRDEVYASVYDPHHHVLEPGKPVILDEHSFKRYRQGNAFWHLSGNGATKAKDLLKFKNIRISSHKTSATYFYQMAKNALLRENFEDMAYFSPTYYKPPNITISNKPLI